MTLLLVTMQVGFGVATFRYQFPYMQQERARPDAPPLLTATVRAAVTAAGWEVAYDGMEVELS